MNLFSLQWLKRGSRDTFGTIIENNVYILIDTSKSMQNHMVFLKEKLRLLIKVVNFHSYFILS